MRSRPKPDSIIWQVRFRADRKVISKSSSRVLAVHHQGVAKDVGGSSVNSVDCGLRKTARELCYNS